MPPTDAENAESVFAAHGPLGYKNYRRNLGRSAVLGTQPFPDGETPRAQETATLIYAGATGETNDPGKAKRPLGDSLAYAMSITTSVVQENEVARLAPPRVVGTVKWGNDGHAQECDFDWHHGTVIHVAGASVEVSARLATNLQTGDLPAGLRTRVGAFVGYNPVSRCRPTLTLSQLSLATNDAFFAIPACCCAVEVYRAAAPGTYTLEWRDVAAGAVLGTVIAASPASDPFLKPGGAHILRVAGVGVGERITALFELTM